MANRHSLLCCDEEALPAFIYTYISQNQSGICSWLDHILSSKKEFVCEVKILYGETFYEHIPIYCELDFPNYAFTESVNEITEVKFNIVWDEFSNDQLEKHMVIFLTTFLLNYGLIFLRAIQLVVITPYIASK